MQNMRYNKCPVCGHVSTLFFDMQNQIQNCIACGYRTNTFSANMVSRWNNQMPVPEFEQSDILYQINNDAQIYFQECLQNDDNAQRYLKKRGFQEQDIERFGFGFSHGHVIEFLLSRGYQIEDVMIAGLMNKGGKDFFSYRIMIPIRDNLKRIIGFGGRVLYDGKPKYMNTQETPIFHKSGVFYGIHEMDWKSDHVILCEGYMDVISMHKAGYRQALAAMGTALTANHCMILRQIGKPIVCVYDSDNAGQTAAIKNMLLLQKFGVSCTAVVLEGAKDPDEFLKAHGKEKMDEQLKVRKTRSELILSREQVPDLYEFTKCFCSELEKTGL